MAPTPRLLLAALAAVAGGCVPYAVGDTPATTAPREVEPSVVFQAVSGRRDLDGDSEPRAAGFMVGNEARLGLDARSDVGVRLVGLGGLVATYKRRVGGPPGGDVGTAVVVGAGLVGASHFHVEATVVGSLGPLRAAPLVTPYAGARLQDLTAFSTDALGTPPALGLFAGARLGWPDLAVSPEIGVFFSPSPLNGDRDVIVAPSVTVRGDRLRRALGL